MAHWEMFYQNVEEEDSEGKSEAKYEPDIYQLDVRCRGQLVRDSHVESVHHEHGGDGDGHVRLEVLLVEVESCLADDHQAHCGYLNRDMRGDWRQEMTRWTGALHMCCRGGGGRSSAR